ncbi:hypothetical protein OCEANICA350_11575 [Oceanicaulis sp. 350]|nr:hypothetical protein OCEANICA350_11575 [Oceanicaulis sp. 350]
MCVQKSVGICLHLRLGCGQVQRVMHVGAGAVLTRLPSAPLTDRPTRYRVRTQSWLRSRR